MLLNRNTSISFKLIFRIKKIQRKQNSQFYQPQFVYVSKFLINFQIQINKKKLRKS